MRKTRPQSLSGHTSRLKISTKSTCANSFSQVLYFLSCYAYFFIARFLITKMITAMAIKTTTPIAIGKMGAPFCLSG